MRAPANGRPACRKLLQSLFGGRASETPRHTPRDASSIRRLTTSGAAPPSQRGCSPLVQSGGEPSERFPRPAGEGKDKGVASCREEGEREEASFCLLAFSSTRGCSSRLVRSRAGWRPLRRSWSLVLGAVLLAAGSSPATGQARPDCTRWTGARIGPCPQLAFPSRAEEPK